MSGKFLLGQLVTTPGALAAVGHEEIVAALARHAGGDWGDVDAEDLDANEEALKDGSRLFSVYHSAASVKFWIVTEADRSTTTVLLPEEY